MKLNSLIYGFIALIVLLFQSCDDPEVPVGSGTVTFSHSLISQNTRLAAVEDIDAIMVSVVDENENVVLDKRVISLTSFGEGWIAESVTLTEGTYHLTEFLVLDADGKAIYATPLSSSDKAKFVTTPLPYTFVIEGENTTQVEVDVLLINDDETPSDFGYAEFVFNIVDESLWDGLIAYYPFNGNASDSTENNDDATVHSVTLAEDRMGNANKAYSLGGNGAYLDFGKSLLPTDGSDWSFSIWAKSLQPSGTRGPLVTQHDDDYYLPLEIGRTFLGVNGDGTDRWTFWIGGDAQGEGHLINDFTPYILNQWVFFTVTSKDKHIKVYVNGEKVGETTSLYNTAVMNTLIGYDGVNRSGYGAPSDFFTGTVDEFRVYNRALEANEVASLHTK